LQQSLCRVRDRVQERVLAATEAAVAEPPAGVLLTKRPIQVSPAGVDDPRLTGTQAELHQRPRGARVIGVNRVPVLEAPPRAIVLLDSDEPRGGMAGRLQVSGGSGALVGGEKAGSAGGARPRGPAARSALESARGESALSPRPRLPRCAGPSASSTRFPR